MILSVALCKCQLISSQPLSLNPANPQSEESKAVEIMKAHLGNSLLQPSIQPGNKNWESFGKSFKPTTWKTDWKSSRDQDIHELVILVRKLLNNEKNPSKWNTLDGPTTIKRNEQTAVAIDCHQNPFKGSVETRSKLMCGHLDCRCKRIRV